MRKFVSLLLGCWLAAEGAARAQSLDQEMSALAASLTKALVAQGRKNVAAVDFTDLQGQATELGRFLSEQLAVEMVLAGGVSMLDRANIKSILAEHKLTEEGLVNPANAKKLGEFAGVDVILIGNVTSLDAGIVLMVKAISTESAKIVAAGRITFPKTSDIQQLLSRGVSSSPLTATAPPTSAARGRGASYQEANTIASKDIGALRVVLKSVMQMKSKNLYGTSGNGIKLSFEFLNRDLQRPMVVAMNAVAATDRVGREMGRVLRTNLLDERGTVWSLSTSSVTGMSVVGVGQTDCNSSSYDPAEIARLLQMQDETNSQTAEGRQAWCAIRGNGYGRYQFIFGSTTPIPPGQSIAVTMDFAQDVSETTSGPSPKFFQMTTEFVVGVVTTDTNKAYSLQNLIFDRVSMPTGGGR